MKFRERKTKVVNKIKVYLTLTLIIFIIACSSEQPELSGELVFDQGTALYELNLETLKKNKIAQFSGHIALSTFIAKVDNNNIIFSNAGILTSVNLETKRIEVISEGTKPCYLRKHDELFYYLLSKDNQISLIVRHGGTDNQNVKIMEYPWPESTAKKYGLYPALSITDDEVIFKGANLNLWTYNIANNKLTDLQISDCIPHLPLQTDNLVVESFSEEKRVYYILNLKDKKRKLCSLTEYESPLVYIPDKNVLLFNDIKYVFPMSERYPLMMLDMATGIKKQILRDEKMHSAVFYTENVIRN